MTLRDALASALAAYNHEEVEYWQADVDHVLADPTFRLALAGAIAEVMPMAGLCWCAECRGGSADDIVAGLLDAGGVAVIATIEGETT
jgi:hypothetical protein